MKTKAMKTKAMKTIVIGADYEPIIREEAQTVIDKGLALLEKLEKGDISIKDAEAQTNVLGKINGACAGKLKEAALLAAHEKMVTEGVHRLENRS